MFCILASVGVLIMKCILKIYLSSLRRLGLILIVATNLDIIFNFNNDYSALSHCPYKMTVRLALEAIFVVVTSISNHVPKLNLY